jgi:G3E family GTPase
VIRPATPVTLVTGFLGAGKTTLLKHLLQNSGGLRLGVVVNDFGAINVDAELIREVQGETQTVRLTNGCICCSIRGDLLETVVQLTAQSDPPQHIVVEASGVSDPLQLVQTFRLPELAPITRLDGVIGVADAAGLLDTLKGESAGLASRQIAGADLVVMNKLDLVSDAQRAAVNAATVRLAPDARVLEARYCSIPVEVLLDTGVQLRSRCRGDGLSTATAAACAADHDHHSAYEAFSWEHASAIDANDLRKALDKLPPAVLRAKGFVYAVQAPRERTLLQTIGRRSSLTRAGPWQEPPCTRLVFIGMAVAGLREQVCSLLDSALIPS